MELELRINGVIASQDIAPNETLLTLLRREGCSSVKSGCETGECGACTVLVDDVPRPSCVMLAAQAGGCTITTAEKLGTPDKLHPLQAAFIEVGAAPCGFCTPGMLLSAQALLKSNASPSESEVRDALSGNLCRCSGYVKPVQAVLRAAAVLRGEKVKPIEYQATVVEEVAKSTATRLTALTGKMRAIKIENPGSVTTKVPIVTAGTSVLTKRQDEVQTRAISEAVPLLNARRAATGRAMFAGDYTPRDMLYGRILTSPHAHAVIRKIDVTRARALPGVHAILTYKDVPRTPYAGAESALPAHEQVQDQYVLDYMVRYAGDRVAAVAAETPEVAEEALQLIDVEYDILPAIFDPRQAAEAAAPRLHSESESHGIYDATRNIVARLRSDVGDVEQGFAAADLVVEGEYIVPAVQSVPLENHTVTTYFDEDNLLVIRTSSQVPHYVRRVLSRLLEMPLKHIRVVTPDVGGGLGGKQELVLEDICAFLTTVTQRPVRLEATRRDEFRSSRTQQQHIVRVKTGVKRDGTIVANQLIILADSGAYGTHALAARMNAASALSLYPCANMRFAAEVLYTNHAPSAALPGSGITQEFFALESHIDEIAKKLGLNALEVRRKNWVKTGDSYPLLKDLHNGKDLLVQIESCGLAACLQIVEEKLKEVRNVASDGRFRHGVGIALSLHGNPAGPTMTSGAMIKLSEDGSFDIFVGMNDNGNGTTTLAAQCAAEVLGVSYDDVFIHTSDTTYTPLEIAVNVSSALYSGGGAVIKAAEQMRRQLLAVAGRMLNVLPEALKIVDGIIQGPQSRQLTVAQVAMHSLQVEGRQLMTNAAWKMQQTPTAFAAQGVEVEVDLETGIVRVIKVVSAVDGGHVINPMIAEAQIYGSITQGLGIGMSEELIYDQKGHLLTDDLRSYSIYNAPDMPRIQTYLVETMDPAGPLGSKSVAEVALYSIIPALANAVADAVGVRMRHLPINPERVLRALHVHMARKE